MQTTYQFDYPVSEEMVEKLDEAGQQIAEDITSEFVRASNISEYNTEYLLSLLPQLQSVLARYSYLLSIASSEYGSPIADMTVVDYGGGHGLMSFLAAKAGATVVYNDIYDVSCDDVETLKEELGYGPNYIVEGDVDDVLNHVHAKAIVVDGVVSYDVIEHIYDIHEFLQKIPDVVHQSGSIVLASGANGLNPMLKRRLEKKHRRVEESDELDSTKGRDSTEGYLYIRKKIIREYSADIGDSTVQMLAEKTRGMMKSDIQQAVDDYRTTGEIPTPDHPTNTCDPNTGNWAEHLLDPEDLANTLECNGVEVRVVAGKPYSDSTLKKLVSLYIRIVENISIGAALRLAPYYVLAGQRFDV